MILICQTAGVGMEQAATGEWDNVVWVDNHRDLLERVRTTELLTGRLVVITSNHFPGETVDASTIAKVVHGMQPDAWVLVYSLFPTFHAVDGVIDKNNKAVPHFPMRKLVTAMIDNPEEFPDLDALFARFPWIQRPR